MTAVGLHFAMRLQQELEVPVGIVSSAWGGTRIEPWTPLQGFQQVPELSNLAAEVQAMAASPEQQAAEDQQHIAQVKSWLAIAERSLAAGKPTPPVPSRIYPVTDQKTPSALYNAMINPLQGLAMRGAIWYQGESNIDDGWPTKENAGLGEWLAPGVGYWRLSILFCSVSALWQLLRCKTGGSVAGSIAGQSFYCQCWHGRHH